MERVSPEQLTCRCCAALGIPRERGSPILSAVLQAAFDAHDVCRLAVVRRLVEVGATDLMDAVVTALDSDAPLPEIAGTRTPALAEPRPGARQHRRPNRAFSDKEGRVA